MLRRWALALRAWWHAPVLAELAAITARLDQIERHARLTRPGRDGAPPRAPRQFTHAVRQ